MSDSESPDSSSMSVSSSYIEDLAILDIAPIGDRIGACYVLHAE
jgi:hypothetical protein